MQTLKNLYYMGFNLMGAAGGGGGQTGKQGDAGMQIKHLGPYVVATVAREVIDGAELREQEEEELQGHPVVLFLSFHPSLPQVKVLKIQQAFLSIEDATNKKPCLGGDYSQDIISTLPDEILSRILSFLPTKDAVKTSVLSKNWIYKWTCITNLDVDDKFSMKSRTRKEIFINFMNRVLSHVQSSKINNVSLKFIFFEYKASIWLWG
ncbi:hypothetical protein L6164_020998 [Bauhinia variegata]|uniref:Uncharacterized protein n=1 Tax=Bauhinia variegata TaxID=167791 RepID=A0ACB9MWW2_BAUVA|nr:hypothetical protein L6164_020998 [Bauhinia variegata]